MCPVNSLSRLSGFLACSRFVRQRELWLVTVVGREGEDTDQRCLGPPHLVAHPTLGPSDVSLFTDCPLAVGIILSFRGAEL